MQDRFDTGFRIADPKRWVPDTKGKLYIVDVFSKGEVAYSYDPMTYDDAYRLCDKLTKRGIRGASMRRCK